MKKILIILLFNMLVIALIYSTYIKSRRTTMDAPKDATVVTEDDATPDNRVVYGKEYSVANIEIYLEEDMPNEYVNIVRNIIAAFPVGVVRVMSDTNTRIILYKDERNMSSDNNCVNVSSLNEEGLKNNLINELCSYTDKVYRISSSDKFKNLTKRGDTDFTRVLTVYVTDKEKLKIENPEICEFFDESFMDSKGIEEILNS